jgi:hypothetical protein
MKNHGFSWSHMNDPQMGWPSMYHLYDAYSRAIFRMHENAKLAYQPALRTHAHLDMPETRSSCKKPLSSEPNPSVNTGFAKYVCINYVSRWNVITSKHH